MAHIIEGTWEEIKTHDIELNGHMVRLIVDPETDDASELADPPFTVRSRDHLVELLLEGVRSTSSVEATPEFWDEMESQLVQRHQSRTDKS
jgi:hypothetical protein